MMMRCGRTGLILFMVVLYGGPFLAGLANHGWAVLPVFAALFLLHVSALQKPDLSTSAGWANLALMGVVQVALVGLAWGLGLGVAGLVGAVMVPVWAPIALTAVAAGSSAWAMRDAAEMNVMLDSAIEMLEGAAKSDGAIGTFDWPEPTPQVNHTLDEARERLRGVGALDPTVIDPIVQWVEQQSGAEAFDGFYDIAGQTGDENEPEVDYALLRYVGVPSVFSQLIDRGEAGLAPQLLLDAPHADVRREARARVLELVEIGAPDNQLPDANRLAGLAKRFPGEGFERLAAACRRD